MVTCSSLGSAKLRRPLEVQKTSRALGPGPEGFDDVGEYALPGESSSKLRCCVRDFVVSGVCRWYAPVAGSDAGPVAGPVAGVVVGQLEWCGGDLVIWSLILTAKLYWLLKPPIRCAFFAVTPGWQGQLVRGPQREVLYVVGYQSIRDGAEAVRRDC
ncbi:MAG: hypothetical protein FWD57_01770 [Polyangiaceae bacterium]|nr:hypothetical protein [Polyangiaceae bacterium]